MIGATVDAWPVSGGDGVISTVRSRIDGGFEIKVPEGTQAVKAVVSPPSGALKAYEVNVSPEAELLLQVEPQGGELVVDVGEEDSFEGRILAVWQGDVGLPVGTLIRWTEGHGVRFLEGGQVRIPQLAPGNYTVCLPRRRVARRWRRRPALLDFEVLASLIIQALCRAVGHASVGCCLKPHVAAMDPDLAGGFRPGGRLLSPFLPLVPHDAQGYNFFGA